jgi:hypothetical protein
MAAIQELPVRVTRRRRFHVKRSATISIKRMLMRDTELGRILYPLSDKYLPMPTTRAECLTMERPCPYVSCQHHLYLDVNPSSGSIKLNFPDLEPWELRETCALDVADRGECMLEEVGEIMNLTRERVRQLELRALRLCKQAMRAQGLDADSLGLDDLDASRAGMTASVLEVMAPGGTISRSAVEVAYKRVVPERLRRRAMSRHLIDDDDEGDQNDTARDGEQAWQRIPG